MKVEAGFSNSGKTMLNMTKIISEGGEKKIKILKSDRDNEKRNESGRRLSEYWEESA